MPVYAYLRGSTVAEAISCDDIATHFHPDYVAACRELSDADAARVGPGWIAGADGTFSPPVKPLVLKPSTMSPLDFQARFLPGEMTSIATAAMASPALFLFMLQMASAQVVDLHDARTVGGVQALLGAGLLTADRAAAILAP